MARFIVVVLETDGEFEMMSTKVAELVPCEDTLSIQAAIARVRRRQDQDWNLFELVDGKYLSRAITFNSDGATVRGLS